MNIHGVQVSSAEVLGDARVKIWRRLTNNQDGLDPADAERYCRTVIRRIVADLLRGFEHQPLDPSPGVAEASARDVLVAPPLDDGVESTLADGVRAAIEVACHAQRWITSAALSFVTLTQYPDLDVTGAPLPRAGAAPDQARIWPCLWFAGKTDGVFPGDGSGDPTQRKRLSRAAEQVKEAVQLAAASFRLSQVSL